MSPFSLSGEVYWKVYVPMFEILCFFFRFFWGWGGNHKYGIICYTKMSNTAVLQTQTFFASRTNLETPNCTCMKNGRGDSLYSPDHNLFEIKKCYVDEG